MKRLRLVAVLTCVALSTPAQPYFVDASELAASAREYREYERASASSQNIDWAEVMTFTSFVQGAYDTLELADLICKPANGRLTAGQLHSVVAKYLRENPEQWHRPAAIVIMEGLRKTFPCPKKR